MFVGEKGCVRRDVCARRDVCVVGKKGCMCGWWM